MPQPAKGPRLGGGPAHERLILANLATSLFEHGKIVTTEAKAKRLRPYAEKLVTFGKRGDLHARRQVARVIRDKSVLHQLFAEIGPRYENRPGGYTRITKLGPRKGDNAPMAQIALVEPLTVAQQAVGEAERARGTQFAESKAPTGATRESAEDLAAESPTAAAVAASAAASDETAAAGGEDALVETTPAEVAESADGTTAPQVEDSAGDVTQDVTGGELTDAAEAEAPAAEASEGSADDAAEGESK